VGRGGNIVNRAFTNTGRSLVKFGGNAMELHATSRPEPGAAPDDAGDVVAFLPAVTRSDPAERTRRIAWLRQKAGIRNLALARLFGGRAAAE